MRRDLMDILACPVCKGELVLVAEEEKDNDVVKGTLTCQKCGEVYPIVDTIPDLRPPSMRDGTAADDFEDMDDFEDEPNRPIIPIVVGVVVAVVLILVGLKLRQSAKARARKPAPLPMDAVSQAVRAAAEAQRQAGGILRSTRAKVADIDLPDLSDDIARLGASLRRAIDDLDVSHLPRDARTRLESALAYAQRRARR